MKHIHKKIGRQIVKFPRHFTKYLTERDTIFATIWVFVFIVVLGSIPLNLGSLNPIKLGLKDFDFNDLGYSKLGEGNDSLERNVVIVNIGHADREGIAYIIEKTAEMNPKVMGLDVLFDDSLDSRQDSILKATFSRHKNLVVAAKLALDTAQKKLAYTKNYFKNASQYGYVNFPYESDFETIRTFYPFKKDHDVTFPSFSAALLKNYNTEAYEKLSKKGATQTIINYSRRTPKYHVIDGEQLVMGDVEGSSINGKIALLAYVNLDPNDVEDKKFTPMNEKYYGKSIPDMNGITVHANIISMAMENNYIKKLPSWTNWLIAILVCWLHMSFFIRYYLESHIWFHLVAKIAQVLSAIFFVWLGIYLYDEYNLKVDMKLSLIVIVMAVDVIYFYEAWAVWMHKKFHYHTVFKPHHH